MNRATATCSLFLTACLPITVFAQVQTIRLPPAPATIAPVAQSGSDVTDPVAVDAASDIVVQGGREEIGPKHDDPVSSGIIVQGGREAIGPKHDDPLTTDGCTALASRPDDDNDPKASTGMLAIGPKQDDPRAPGATAQRLGVAEAGCLPDRSASP